VLSFGTLCTACIFIGDSSDPNQGDSGDAAICGDGRVEQGEECDQGALNDAAGACTTSCTVAACGDGFVQKGVEACDDGNQQDGDGCNNDCVVSGTPAWTESYDGAANGQDVWNSVAVDTTGSSIYVAGSEATADQGLNAVVRRYDAAGKVLWTQSYNGAANLDDQAIGVAVDAKGQAIAIGQETNADKSTDIWVRKYSPAGEPIWTQKLNGGAAGFNNTGYKVATNSDGDIFLAAGVQTVTTQGRNIFVAKLASDTGAVVWVDALDGAGGGGGDDEAFSVAVDAAANIIAAGYTTTAKGTDAWVRKYKDNGSSYTILWTQTYNDPFDGADSALSVAADLRGNVIVSGAETNSSGKFTSWIRKYDSNGNVIWTKGYDGAMDQDNAAVGVAADATGAVIVTGYATLANATTDVWVRKYSAEGAVLWTQSYNDEASGNDAGNDIAVDANGFIYVAGSEAGTAETLDGWLRKLAP
jgi:cysteine-rich repeat protein